MALNLRSLWHAVVPSGLTTLYVSVGSGADTNNGLSPGSAFQTISKALSVASPGTRIIVSASGTYPYQSIYGLSGTSSAWVSIESANDTNRPLISVADNSGDDGVDVQLSNYVGLYGFEVEGLQTSTNTNPSGVCVFRGSTFIRVWNNDIHDFPGGGVNCFYVAASNGLPAGSWDCVDVAFNQIYNCCKYNPDNTSGISFYGGQDTTGKTLDARYGYRAIGNYVWACECTVPYTPGGVNYVTDGNAISFDSLAVANNLNPGLSAYDKRGLAEANLAVGCGGRGLTIYNTIDVDDFANTYIGNLQTISPNMSGGMDTEASYSPAWSGSNGVVHAGNVICPLNPNGDNTNDGVSTYEGNVILGGTQAVASADIDKRSVGLAYWSALTQAMLASVQPVSAFIPAASDQVARQVGSTGWQALGAGPRPVATWAAGALEQPQGVRVAL